MAIHELEPGAVLGGGYQVLDGGGGLYRARHPDDGREVAVRLLPSIVVTDAHLRERFVEQLAAARRVRHPGVVSVLAGGVDGERAWLVTEMCAWPTLAEHLGAAGPCSPPAAAQILAAAATALVGAHGEGVAHRRLEPARVLVAQQAGGWRACLAELGVAEVLTMARCKAEASIEAPVWLAPEQTARRAVAGTPADVWSLGLLGFWMLTGKSYWLSVAEDGSPAELLREVVMDPLEPASERAAQLGAAVPASFDAWFARCVVREPDDRLTAAGALAALAAALPAPRGARAFDATVAAGPSIMEALAAAGRSDDHRSSDADVDQGAVTSSGERAPLSAEPAGSEPIAGTSVVADSTVDDGPLPAALEPWLPPPSGSVPPSGTIPDVVPADADATRQRVSGATPPGTLNLPSRTRTVVGASLPQDVNATVAASPEMAAAIARLTAPEPAGGTVPVVDAGQGLRPRPASRTVVGSEDDMAVVQRASGAPDLLPPPGTARASATVIGEPPPMGAIGGAPPGPLRAVEPPRKQAAPRRGRAPTAALLAGAALGAAALMGGGLWLYTRHQDSALREACAEVGGEASSRSEACRELCDDEGGRPCVLLGNVLRSNLSAEPNAARELLAAYQRACDEGDALGCRELGSLHRHGLRGVSARDEAKAAGLFSKACDAGELSACALLGLAHERGAGVELSTQTARDLYQRACDGDDPLGCAYLGLVYELGHGIAVDAGRASGLFDKAAAGLSARCDDGQAAECAALGVLHELGKGVSQDETRARALYERACDAGAMMACNNLAVLRLVQDKQRAEARVELSKACEAGEAAACTNVGSLDAPPNSVLRRGAGGQSVLKLSCDGVFTTGCAGWGEVLPVGAGPGANAVDAAQHFRRGCDAGEPNACVNLGALALLGKGVPKDRSRAAALFGKACDAGDAAACGELGSLHVSDARELRDPSRGRTLMRQACDWGERDSCVVLASERAHAPGATDTDAAEAAVVQQKACDGGVMLGCYALASLYEQGKGVRKDEAQAALLYRRACDEGNKGYACVSLGRMHIDGRGVAKNAAEGIRLYTATCDRADMQGCVALGFAYHNGQGVPTDLERARGHYQQACDAGLADACSQLAVLYASGQGVERDPPRAYQLFTQACEDGAKGACGNLGIMQADGFGTTRDVPAAKDNLEIACEANIEWACTRRKSLGK